MYEARSAEYIGIYEPIVIEFFLRLKIDTEYVQVFQDFIQKTSISLSVWLNHEILEMQFHG